MNKPTPGPWMWWNNSDGWHLATPDRGRLIVMDFARRGMRGAQPRFAVWEGEDRLRSGGRMVKAEDLADLAKHPDACLIANAPELLVVAKLFAKILPNVPCDTKGIDGSAQALNMIELVNRAIARAEGRAVVE